MKQDDPEWTELQQTIKDLKSHVSELEAACQAGKAYAIAVMRIADNDPLKAGWSVTSNQMDELFMDWVNKTRIALGDPAKPWTYVGKPN